MNSGSNRRTGAVLCAVVGCLAAWQASAGAASSLPLRSPSLLHVTRHSIVSPDAPVAGCGGSRDYNNPQAVVDPTDPSVIVVTYSSGDGQARLAATSSDKGGSWSSTVLPGLTACTGNPDGGSVNDPWLAIGADRRVYSSASWVNFTTGTYPRTGRDVARGYVSPAAAPGAAFASPLEVDPLVSAQRVTLLADARVPGRVTAFYEHASDVAAQPEDYVSTALPLFGDALYTRTSDDGGRTFGTPSVVAVPLPGHTHVTLGLVQSGASLVAVRADVDLTALAAGIATGAPVPETLYAHRSVDGGSTWTTGTYVGTYMFGRAFAIPDVTASPDGDVYVTWPEGEGPSHVEVARSTDQGQSWTTVAAATVAGMAFEPTVAARSGGHAAVAFYELAGDVLSQRAASTRDGAVSWSQPVSFSPDVANSALSGSTDGPPVGPFQDVVAVSDGYAATFTTEVDGHEAVVLTRLTDES